MIGATPHRCVQRKGGAALKQIKFSRKGTALPHIERHSRKPGLNEGHSKLRYFLDVNYQVFCEFGHRLEVEIRFRGEQSLVARIATTDPHR